MIKNWHIDQLNSMYPSVGFLVSEQTPLAFRPEFQWSSMYGYSFGSCTIKHRQRCYQLESGQYFSIFLADQIPTIECEDSVFVVIRLGYKCQDTIGWVETQGRLSYIDGCSDSLLIYPPRQGDPSLNLLYFPAGIEQTRHLHPSIRLGCVAQGSGISDVWHRGRMTSETLATGDIFCLEENELHRFRTQDQSMTVIAWHPDGDWGPTDHNHTMLNRTYINQR